MTPDNYFQQRRPRLPDFESPQRPQLDWLPPAAISLPSDQQSPDLSSLGTTLGNVIRGRLIGTNPPTPEVRLPAPQVDVPEPPLPPPSVTLPTDPNMRIRPRRAIPPVSY